MKIAIFGLGYVGCVSTGCLAQNGYQIVGVDINPIKVDLINNGIPTIIEKDIDTIIARQHKEGKISATLDYLDAVRKADVSFICVGTPSLETGQLNLEFVYETGRQIGEGLKKKDEFHVVVIRSTVFPGTNEKVGEIISEVSGKIPDKDFTVVSNPEFLREGSAVEDYYNPALTVVGSENGQAVSILREIYRNVKAPFIQTDIKSAEMIKYINNAFHALKISFANEVGNICKSIGIDSYKVMDLFKRDDRLNISRAYFNPGMAYGGSCLPKDLKGLATIAHDNYVKVPVIGSIGISNDLQKDRIMTLIQKNGKKKIGLLGLAFKKGTDDLRYSPSVALAEELLGKGYDLEIYDKNVQLSALIGANKGYIDQHLPHISGLLKKNLREIANEAELIVIAHKPDPEEIESLKDFQGVIIDLVKIPDGVFKNNKVEGLSW